MINEIEKKNGVKKIYVDEDHGSRILSTQFCGGSA